MIETTDIVLRTIAVMAALLLGALLLSTARRRRAALPGALFCFAVAAFFMTSISGARAQLGIFGYPLTALCVTKAVWFWLFARALFSDDVTLGARHLGIAGAVAVAGTWQQAVFLDSFRAGTATAWETIFGFGVEGILLAIVLLGLHEAWRGMASDLVERRRRLRLGFIAATGAYLLVTLAVQSTNLLLAATTPLLATRANMTFVAVACIGAAWLLLQLRTESWLDPTRVADVVPLNRSESAVLAKLDEAMKSERIYLEEGLKIGELADRLGTSEHIVRSVINRGLVIATSTTSCMPGAFARHVKNWPDPSRRGFPCWRSR